MRAKRDIVRNTIHFVGRISLISPRSRLIRCRRLIDCLKFFAFAPSYSKRRPTSSRREAQKWITRLLLITDPLMAVMGSLTYIMQDRASNDGDSPIKNEIISLCGTENLSREIKFGY